MGSKFRLKTGVKLDPLTPDLCSLMNMGVTGPCSATWEDPLGALSLAIFCFSPGC